MRTIAVLNQKGGVGKTTTVVNTAAALAALGSKVIAIDFDPQAHLTIHLGLEPASINSGSYKVLTQSARLESEIMMVRPNLWLLPANIDLVGAESELVSVVLFIAVFYQWFTSGRIPQIKALAAMFSLMSSIQFTLFAMWFDMENNKELK